MHAYFYCTKKTNLWGHSNWISGQFAMLQHSLNIQKSKKMLLQLKSRIIYKLNCTNLQFLLASYSYMCTSVHSWFFWLPDSKGVLFTIPIIINQKPVNYFFSLICFSFTFILIFLLRHWRAWTLCSDCEGKRSRALGSW